ncbi:MAG: sterol desaturase family protein [Bdellovibrionales bacterium]|nr:sterol desaturase family protein [Bdellovibrionales bacterium]NQZ18190.1 sterol desaturase family protein [Bdellovibrionales bacterium]
MVLLTYKEKSIKKAFHAFFNKKLFTHDSFNVDMSLFVFNIFLKLLIFTFVTLSASKVSLSLVRLLYNSFPDFKAVTWDYYQLMAVYTVVSFIALDFSRFFQHYLFHKIPFLWRFHKVHHSAEVMTPLTLFRTHPFESVVGAFRRTLVLGVVTGSFVFFAEAKLGVWAILGVNGLDFIFNIFGSNLRHSHIWLSFGPLNYIFVSPAQHQIHHSRDKKYYDTNLGIVFSFWDQLFGTFYHPKKREFISFGVRGEHYKSFGDAVLAPFRR